MCEDMEQGVNWTLDGPTHRLLGIVAKECGLTKIGMIRSLVVSEAIEQGKRIPKELKKYGEVF